MPISVACPKCAAKLNAPDSAAGKKVKCPKCAAVVVVPEPLPAQPEFEVVDEAEPVQPKKPATKPRAVVKAEVEADEDDRPRKKAKAVADEDDERPRKKRRDDDDDDQDEDRPRKKKKRRQDDEEGGVSMTRNIVMGVLLLILLGVAGYVFYDRYKDKKDSSSNSSDEGQPVTPRLQTGATPPNLTPQTPTGGGGGPAPKLPGPKQPVGTPGQPQTLTSPAGFKVTFPGPYVSDALPANLREKIGVPLTAYISADIGSAQFFLAGTADFPATATAAEKKEIVDRIVKAAIEDEGESQVTSRKTVTAGGRSWEELTAKEKGGGTSVTRMLQTDRRLYVLAVAKQNGTPSADAMNKFFDSFELTK